MEVEKVALEDKRQQQLEMLDTLSYCVYQQKMDRYSVNTKSWCIESLQLHTDT